MNFKFLIPSLVLATAVPAVAETVLIDEDFNGEYTKSIEYFLDDDGQQPHKSIAAIFYSAASDKYMPWWVARDNASSKDLYIASHSYYVDPAESFDWLISHTLDITTEGFVLEFDAQSVPVRSLDNLSDLSLFVLEDEFDPFNLPLDPVMVWEKVPYGKDPDNCENDWTHYTYDLSAFAGKKVRLCFVNANFNNDILCVDNIRVSRHDAIDFTLNPVPEYTADATYAPVASLLVTEDNGLKDWKVTLECGGSVLRQWSGDFLAKGESMDFSGDIPLDLGKATEFCFTIEAENTARIPRKGEITRMSFMPVHRIIYEESTSLKCGNCPVGIYNTEQILADETYGDRILPIAVHIAALGFDPMATPRYYGYLPETQQAPLFWINRANNYEGFIPAYDCDFDIANPNSAAAKLAREADKPVFLAVDVDAEWVVSGVDTTAVKCTATVRPALDINNKEYRVSFILTENNVGLDNSTYWIQDNYMSGLDFASRVGGWCDLPQYVVNARYHDVGRAVSEFFGHEGSLPLHMTADNDYTFTFTMNIPDTYNYSKDVNKLISESIRREMCEITAIVTDYQTGRVINAARVPMSEKATRRFTTADLVKALGGIDDVVTDLDNEADAVYYDLRGVKVTDPSHGIYIRVTPSGACKVRF